MERDNFKERLVCGAETTGRYDMPVIGVSRCAPRAAIPFNRALTEREPKKKWLHFFIDDYQFERLWNTPDKYLPLLRRFEGIITPDFSLYLDMPRAQQLWNCWRNRALAFWMRREGLSIVPTVSWSDAASCEWCFDGLPIGGSVAISTNGVLASAVSRYYFMRGYNAMLERLQPDRVFCVGSPIALAGNVVFLPGYLQTMLERLR